MTFIWTRPLPFDDGEKSVLLMRCDLNNLTILSSRLLSTVVYDYCNGQIDEYSSGTAMGQLSVKYFEVKQVSEITSH